MHKLSIFCILLMLLAGNAFAGPDGSALYRQNCAACHGIHGGGGVGVPLALPDFQKSVSDTYLKNTIRFGRPGRVMPAHANLSDAQISAIIKHVRGFANVTHPRVSTAHIKGDVAHGKMLFAKNCTACHGANGQGGTGTGVTFSRPRDLPIIAPALNNPGFLAAASDTMIKNTLINGRKNTPMQSFLKKGLSEQDINDVVSYIRSFEKAAQQKPFASTENQPATLEMESPYDLETTINNLKAAVVAANFKLIRQQNMENGMVAADKESPNEVILYFCNFKMLNDVLAIDPRVGMFLPCRVTILKIGNKVKLMTINPKSLSRLFNNNELDKACDNMYNVYKTILEEATL